MCVLDKDWSSINLDFVIGGIDGCGTASLHMNLEKHAETWLKIGQENCVFMMAGDLRWETSHEASIFEITIARFTIYEDAHVCGLLF